MNNNERHQQQGRQRDGRNRQAQQEFGRQGREDESYRYSSSEGDDFRQANRGQYSAGPAGRYGNEARWHEGTSRQGEYAQQFGHGSSGYGGQTSFGTEPYPGASGYGGYGNAPSYGSGRDEYLGQGRGAQYAGPEFNASRYGSSGFEPSPYMGSQGGYPGSGYQGGYQGLPSGALGGYSAAQASYGSAYQGAYGPGTADEAGRRAFGSSYGEASGYGDSGLSGMQGHRGKGPKGYMRSDDRIKEDICERLSDDPVIDASDISVEARQGVVTLSGTVDSRQLKHRVEDLIERCSGVKDIENRLTVKSPSSGSGSRSAASGASGSSSTTGASSTGTGTPGSRPS
jgi:osmotically-inducible protein OsmY